MTPSDFHLSKRENLAYIMQYCMDAGYITKMPSRITDIEDIRMRDKVAWLCDHLLPMKIVRKKYAHMVDADVPNRHASVITADGLSGDLRRKLDATIEDRGVMLEAHRWYDSGRPGGLILGQSEGKTFAAASLIYGSRKKLDGAKVGLMVPESSLIGAIKSGRDREKSLDRFSADLLIIDYMGYGSMFGADGYRASLDWIRKRIEAGKRTIMTYKGTTEMFRDRYGGAPAGSIFRLCGIMESK